MTTTTEVMDAVTAAAATTFQELCGVAVMPRGRAEVSTALPPADTFAVIELRRDAGGLLICGFPSAFLEAVTSRYLPAFPALTRDLLDDAAGEFANVVAGQTKTLLKGTPYHFSLSTPIVSSQRSEVWACDAGGAVLHFDSEVGPFWIGVFAVA